MSPAPVALVFEDHHFRGMLRLLLALARRGEHSPTREVVALPSDGNGSLLGIAQRVLRNRLPDRGGVVPHAVGVVVDADRAHMLSRSRLREYERWPPDAVQVSQRHTELQGQVNLLLREGVESSEAARLSAFVVCWSQESVALASPGSLSARLCDDAAQASEVEAMLTRCAPVDPREVPEDSYTATFRKPQVCFRELYRLARKQRPGKERMSDFVGDLAAVVDADGDGMIRRVVGLDGLVRWLRTSMVIDGGEP